MTLNTENAGALVGGRRQPRPEKEPATMAEEEGGTRRRTKKDPEFTDVTCIVAIIGENRTDSGQKIVHLPGEDVKMKTALARRLASSARPRVAIGKDDREAARKNAKRIADVLAKRQAAAGKAQEQRRRDG